MPPLPWAACSLLYKSFGEEIFPNIQSEPPLGQLEAFSSYSPLSLVTWEKRLTPTSLQPPFR